MSKIYTCPHCEGHFNLLVRCKCGQYACRLCSKSFHKPGGNGIAGKLKIKKPREYDPYWTDSPPVRRAQGLKPDLLA